MLTLRRLLGKIPIEALCVASITVTSTHPSFTLRIARTRKAHSGIQQTTMLIVLSDFLYRMSKLSRADHSAMAALNSVNVANC